MTPQEVPYANSSDLKRLHNLILQYAAGAKAVKQDRDQLEGLRKSTG